MKGTLTAAPWLLLLLLASLLLSARCDNINGGLEAPSFSSQFDDVTQDHPDRPPVTVPPSPHKGLSLYSDTDISLLVNFHGAIRSNEVYNMTAAMNHLSNIADKSILKLPLLGPAPNSPDMLEIPLFHHLLNLYFTSSDPKRHSQIEQLVTLVLEWAPDVDVNAPFRSDPHVLLKALLVRDMVIASGFAAKLAVNSVATADVIQALNQLYSIPCEAVPLTKLLLHADTILRKSKHLNATSLLLSAAASADAKPSVKAKDLFQLSTTYVTVVDSLASSSVPLVSLSNITAILDEASSLTHRKLLQAFVPFGMTDQSSLLAFSSERALQLLKIIGMRNDGNGNRNVFHSLAVSGAKTMMEDVKTLVQSLLQSVSAQQSASSQELNLIKAKRMVATALKAKDARGLRPIDYTALRYGVDSPLFAVMTDIYQTVGVQVDSEPLATMYPAVHRYRIDTEPSSTAFATNALKRTLEDSGGWDTTELIDNTEAEMDLIQDESRCDIKVVFGPLPGSAEFYRDYISTGTPVIFREALSNTSSLRKAFSKRKFVSRYGKEMVPLSKIPYSGSFGLESSSSTLGRVADMIAGPKRNDSDTIAVSMKTTGDGRLGLEPSALYAFTGPSNSWRDKLRKDAPLPSCIDLAIGKNGNDGAAADGSVEWQFYLGPKGSGAPIHFHGHAINSCAFGKKKWFLYPPSHAIYSTVSAWDLLTKHNALAQGAMTCTQHGVNMGCRLSACIFLDGSANEGGKSPFEPEHNEMYIGTKHTADRTTAITLNEVEVDMSHFIVATSAIGLGGFGLIRQVTKLSGDDKGSTYALKSLSKSAVLQRSTGPIAVMTELKALALLKGCKFVCNLHYAFQDDRHLYMVMDLAKGGDLRYNLKNSPNNRIPESVAQFYFCQVTLAVDRCHSMSILHRDVKPENIMLMESGYIKLTDFGVSKILHDLNDCTSTSGTHGYMAPEIYSPGHRHGPGADWFALGVTLHELLTGARPFESSKLQAFRNGYVTDFLPLNVLDKANYITHDCKDILYRMLDLNQHRRLGATTGYDEIRSHPWLRTASWSGIANLAIPAPFMPNCTVSNCDINGADAKNAIKVHLSAPEISADDQLAFQYYEFCNHPYRSSIARTKRSTEEQVRLQQMNWTRNPYATTPHTSSSLVAVAPSRNRDGQPRGSGRLSEVFSPCPKVSTGRQSPFSEKSENSDDATPKINVYPGLRPAVQVGWFGRAHTDEDSKLDESQPVLPITVDLKANSTYKRAEVEGEEDQGSIEMWAKHLQSSHSIIED